MKPETETMSPYVGTVKSGSRGGSNKMAMNAGDDSALKCTCTLCGKTYRTEASLRFHKYECNVEPKFKCNYCNYVGKRNTTLRKHIKARHDNRVDNM